MKEKVVFFPRSTLHGEAQQFSTTTLSILISVEPVVDTCEQGAYELPDNRQRVLSCSIV